MEPPYERLTESGQRFLARSAFTSKDLGLVSVAGRKRVGAETLATRTRVSVKYEAYRSNQNRRQNAFRVPRGGG